MKKNRIGEAAGSFTAFCLIFKSRDKIGHMYMEKLPDGEELKKYLSDAWEDFDKITACQKRIKDSVMRREAEKLSKTAGHQSGDSGGSAAAGRYTSGGRNFEQGL